MWNFGTIYKQLMVNFVESFYIINLALLAGWTEYNRQGTTDYEQHQVIIIYIYVNYNDLVLFIVCTKLCKVEAVYWKI